MVQRQADAAAGKNLHSTLLGSRSYSTYRFNMHQSVLSDIIEGASEDETIQRIYGTTCENLMLGGKDHA